MADDTGIDMNVLPNPQSPEHVEETSANAPSNTQSHHSASNRSGHPPLTLQEMFEMFQDALTQNRIEMERIVDAKLSSRGTVNHPPGSGDGPEKPTGDETSHKRTERPSFKTFKACGATEFLGKVDPAEACEWLDNMENVFLISHCWDIDRVPYAAFMLKKRALDWWKNLGNSMGDARQALTWEQFSAKFLSQYCPADLKIKYEREFAELKQGNMSVAAYEAEFHKRAKFATDYVASESARIRKFVSGLRWEIREFVKVRDIPTLEKAAEYARSREDDLALQESELMPPPKRPCKDNFSSQSSFSRPSRHPTPMRTHSQTQSHAHSRSFSQA